jgi:hypothetical protein
MPKNLLNDRDIEEFYVNIQPPQLEFSYVDYHYTTRIGAAYTRPTAIPAGLAPSYVLPTTIDCVGHWNDAGFQSSVYVVKTNLNTTALLTQYLGYVPFNNHTVAMYDYFMTVQLNTGFGSATNRVFTLHIHRGYSAHQRTVGAAQVWVGDYLTTVANPAPGVYHKIIRLGIEYSYKPVRTDNIYSDSKYVVIDNTQIPPKKYLDIYESINPPVDSSFTVTPISGNASNTFGVINTITSAAQLPPNFVVQGLLALSRSATTRIASYRFTGPATQVDRATYSLGFKFRFTGEDFRAFTSNNVWCYDSSFSLGYQPDQNVTGARNTGTALRGLLNLNNPNFDNFLLQNKNPLQSAFVTANFATINSISRSSVIPPVDVLFEKSQPFIDFNITGRFSRGYAELTDATGNFGMNLTFPKIVRVVPQLKIFDKNHVYTNDDIHYAIKSPQGNITLDQVPSSWSTTQTLSFKNFDSRAFVTQATRSDANYLVAGNSVSIYNKTLQNNYLGKQLLTIDLDARLNGLRTGAALNTRDSNTDASVYMRGQMVPAMTYSRRSTLDLTSIFNVINLLNKPVNSMTGIYLNAYRYLRFTVNPAPGLVNFTQPYRLTIWESAGNQVIEKYWTGTITFPGRVAVNVTIDLLFPNFPGIEIDTQDDPYPRSRTAVNSAERVNNVYYGCNRVLRIDLNSDGNVFDPTNFSCQALIIPASTNTDVLNFVPSSGTDLNIKEIEVPSVSNNITTSTYGRRFLLMRHDNKPEEETDIVYTSVGGVLTNKNLTVLEFVNRLNSLHNGLNCVSLNDTLLAVYMQGFHWNISSTAIKDNTTISINPNTAATINASEIYQGLYLDFPPFIQDFNNHAIADTWLNQVNPRRRSENATEHMEIRAYCNLRGYAYGSQSDANNLVLTGTNKISSGEVIVSPSGGGTIKSSTSVSTSSGTISNGFYTTGRPHVYPLYDYLTSQNNLVQIISGALQVGNYSTFAKFLPAKITRISFGVTRAYITNPYVSLAAGYNYISANEIITKNQVVVCLGQTYNSLSPYITPTSATNARITADGLIRILLINSYDNQSYDFKPTTNIVTAYKYGYNPNLIIRNKDFDLSSNLFSESYYNGNVSNSIAFNNPSLVDENSWYYYDDPQYIMSKCFAYTENNSYSSSPYHNDLYCLGTLRNTLFLQKTSLDRILQISSTAQYNQVPNAPEQVILLDGANYTGTEFVGVISSGTNSGIVNKPGSLIQIDDNVLLAFYNLSANLLNIYCRLIEYGSASPRITLVNSGVVSLNALTALSNVSATYDPIFNIVRFVFMTSLTVGGTNYNNIIYAESPYIEGTISSPTIFHHIAGNYINGQFIANNVFYTATNNDNQVLPYQKPGIVVYNNSDQKGQVGIFYVNNSGALCSTSIIPFVSTDPKIEYK